MNKSDPNTHEKAPTHLTVSVHFHREKLFKRINALPTVYEILSGKATAKPKANKKPPPAESQVRQTPHPRASENRRSRIVAFHSIRCA